LDLTLLRHQGKGSNNGKGHELTMEWNIKNWKLIWWRQVLLSKYNVWRNFGIQTSHIVVLWEKKGFNFIAKKSLSPKCEPLSNLSLNVWTM
jgi:hypothetical protein